MRFVLLIVPTLVGVDPVRWTPHLLGKGRLFIHAETRPYPTEFRRQMGELVRAGWSPEAVAREVEPSRQTIRNW